jgi:hypothetical protein
MKYRKHLLAAIGCLLIGGVVFGALSTTIYWRVERTNVQYIAKLGVASTGSFEVDGTTTLNGATTLAGTVTQTGAQTYAADVTLDDGTTASPSLIFKDGTDQTATFSKADSGNLSMTIGTTDSLQVLTGNLAVGNGTPTTTMDGEDAYVEGTFEVDGTARFDGAIDANSTSNFAGAMTLGAPGITYTAAAVSLTSPSVAVDLASKSVITLNSDANQTGITLSNGVVGNFYTFIMGAGSNTVRFDDDGLNMALGGNITLTEGEADILVLYCYATDDYACYSDRSGN